MFRNMVTSLFAHGRITTTDAKAKELRPIAEKMITLGKRGDLHAVRLAASYIREKSVVTKLFSTIAPRYVNRPGGYTRIVKLGLRPGDNAQLSMIELVEEEFAPKVMTKTKKASVATAPVTAPSQEVSGGSEVSESAAAEEASPVLTKVEEADETCEAKAD
jgi:large subunit ribosomal protein L17